MAGVPNMASVNKVILIGRLTADPETHTFSNGGKVANIRFAFTGTRKKNPQSGQWEDEPCFIDCKAFNRGDPAQPGRKLADLCEQYLKKGHQVYFEGHLVLETWEDKNGGGKRSKLVVVIDDVQFLEPRADGGEGMSRAPRQVSAPPPRQPALSSSSTSAPANYTDPDDGSPAADEPEGDIPF
jgi:single-strand DNA-binding protein